MKQYTERNIEGLTLEQVHNECIETGARLEWERRTIVYAEVEETK